MIFFGGGGGGRRRELDLLDDGRGERLLDHLYHRVAQPGQ
jgi:hypothetical protein